jgi:hypothetical protein
MGEGLTGEEEKGKSWSRGRWERKKKKSQAKKRGGYCEKPKTWIPSFSSLLVVIFLSLIADIGLLLPGSRATTPRSVAVITIGWLPPG